MKLRIMGTKQECEQAKKYYSALRTDININYVEISELYPNSGSSTLYRLYVEVSYRDSFYKQPDSDAREAELACRR